MRRRIDSDRSNKKYDYKEGRSSNGKRRNHGRKKVREVKVCCIGVMGRTEEYRKNYLRGARSAKENPCLHCVNLIEDIEFHPQWKILYLNTLQELYNRCQIREK